MTKRKIKSVTILMLALSVVLFSYFGYLACCSDHAAAADSSPILSKVVYNTMNCGVDGNVYMSYFQGYRGSPTVGTYFAYGLGGDLFRGNKLPTTYTELNGVTKYMYYDNVPFLSEDFYFIFMISFDFLGNDFVGTEVINGVKYTVLGYLNIRDRATGNTLFWELKILRNGDSISIYETVSGRYSVIPNFTGTEGEFINVTLAVPAYFFNGDFFFNTRIVFARNYYGSFGIDNVELANHAFLNSYVFQSLSHNLYAIDNLFASYDDQFSEILQESIKNSYDEGYKKGYALASQEVDSITSLTWLTSIFNSLGALFDFRLFGGVTLGTIVFIPIILGIVMLILHFVRG